jgi:flavin reductase (DIM6/NTAB) family NADH-FMN oxidoreductase RutF
MAADENAGQNGEQVRRNRHPDFKTVEASRPPFDASTTFTLTQTPNPNWSFGSGANNILTNSDRSHKHRVIDPHASGRPSAFNYKLLISAIVPRPIALLSTRSADGTTTNLAPFSFFSVIGHDPPLFTIGFATPAGSGPGYVKDSLRNLRDRGECVINLVSEGFVEAANSTSINTPYGMSEWDVSGLTPAYDCETVGCARVREAVFAIEGKLASMQEFESRANPGRTATTLAVVEGTRFWLRDDAVNEEGTLIDPKVSRVPRRGRCVLNAGMLTASVPSGSRSCDPSAGWEVSHTAESSRGWNCPGLTLRRISAVPKG